WYTFPSSTTAGISEIQNLAGNYPLASSGGVKITLGEGVYTFTTPIAIDHNMEIGGAGMWATVLLYTGPTDAWGIQDVIANLPQPIFFGNQNQDIATNCSLIRLMALPFNDWGPNIHFHDFAIQPANNFPCVLVGGKVNNLYQERCGFFSPDI